MWDLINGMVNFGKKAFFGFSSIFTQLMNQKENLLCKTTGWHNNCGLNCLTHFLFNKLEKNELQTLFEFNPEYQSLLQTFQEYYNLSNTPSWDEIKTLLTGLSVPADREAVLAPVLRKHLGKIMLEKVAELWETEAIGAFSEFLNTGESNDIAGPIVNANQAFFIEFKGLYDSEINLIHSVPFSAAEQEQAIAKIQLNKKELSDNNIQDQMKFARRNTIEEAYALKAKNYWLNEGGGEKYIDYLADLNNKVMVSSHQLGLLCQKLNINLEVYTLVSGEYVAQDLPQGQFFWVMKVYNEGLHWVYEEPDRNAVKATQHNNYYPDSFYETDTRLGLFKTYSESNKGQINKIKDYVAQQMLGLAAHPMVIDLTTQSKKRKREESELIDGEEADLVNNPAKRYKKNANREPAQSVIALNQGLITAEQEGEDKKKNLNLGSKASLAAILFPLIHDDFQPESAWLSDDFVERYIQEKITSSSNCNDIKLFNLNPDALDLTDRFERFAKKNSAKTKIIWPICHGSHFHLILIAYNKENNQVYICGLDGFNETKKQEMYISKASVLANLLYPNAEKQINTSEPVFLQNNTSDCGVVVCYFAEHFIEKRLPEFFNWIEKLPAPSTQAKPYTPYREKIGEVLYGYVRTVLEQENRLGVDSSLTATISALQSIKQ